MITNTFLTKLSEVCEWEYYSDVPNPTKKNRTLIRVTRYKNLVPSCDNCGNTLEEPNVIHHIKTKKGVWIERCANCKKYKDDNGNYTIDSKSDAY
jgi:predicted RNA-binding Zn-ribbon protein involved in translation (DUF1610 family)